MVLIELIEKLENELGALKLRQLNQDSENATDIISVMLALTDIEKKISIYSQKITSIESMLEDKEMAKLYARLVSKNVLGISDVPAEYLEEVRRILGIEDETNEATEVGVQ